MKLSRLHKMMAGVLIILTGIGLLLDSLHIINFGLFDLWPMVLVYFGARLWGQHKRIGGGILFSLGVIIALDMWLGIGVDDLFKLAVPVLLIYFGFRLLRGKTPEKGPLTGSERSQATAEQAESDFSSQADTFEAGKVRNTGRWKKWRHYVPQAGDFGKESGRYGGVLLPKDSRSSLIGDFHLTSGRFELSQLHVWHGIGDVIIDLSRAMLVQEEAVLIVEGWVGDVTIYVPVDLPVSVSAEVSVGDLEVLGHRQGGISRSLMMRSDHYENGMNKVNLHISLLVGDIKVKYI